MPIRKPDHYVDTTHGLEVIAGAKGDWVKLEDHQRYVNAIVLRIENAPMSHLNLEHFVALRGFLKEVKYSEVKSGS